MTSSGTYDWLLDNAGVVIEAFSRCGVRPTELTREHFISATRSLNLALQSWSNKGVNLWQVELISIPLEQGVPTYELPTNLVNILDAYLETYSLQTSVAQVPNFSTVVGLTVVTVNIIQNGLTAGNWINIVIPVAIGGIVLQGLYQVQTILNANQFTIAAVTPAANTVTAGGQLPIFTTVLNSENINVNLPAHNLSAGNTFTVQEVTTVGGLILNGPYVVAAAVDADNFTITDIVGATANDTETENSGNAVIQTQYNSGPPIDRIMTSISRTDYAAQPNKLTQGFPTTFWFDRLSPVANVTLWQVADGNGPYVMFIYGMRRIQDAYAAGGQTADVPYRFLDALCADLAMRLARKYAVPLVQSLMLEAQEAWQLATVEDRERVQMFIQPDLSGYL